MNAITAKLAELSPTYKPHNAQKAAIRKAGDPVGCANNIAPQVEALKAIADRDWGAGVAEIDDLLSGVIIHPRIRIEPETSKVSLILSNLPKKRAFELGKKAGTKRYDWLDGVFLETHNRLPAETGRRYYLGQYHDGRPMADIVAEIEGNAP